MVVSQDNVEPLLSVKEAAEYLGVSERTIRTWVKEYKIGTRFGKKLIRFRREELDEVGRSPIK